MGIFQVVRWVGVGDSKRAPWMNGFRGEKTPLQMKKDKKKGFKGSSLPAGRQA